MMKLKSSTAARPTIDAVFRDLPAVAPLKCDIRAPIATMPRMPDWVYLDNNATTRPLDAVVECMRAALTDGYANPSSMHQLGQSARHRLECARAQVAELIGAQPGEIVFTSSGTESINLAIRGTLEYRPAAKHVVISSVEHSSVRRLTRQLAREGYRIDEIGVDGLGRLDAEQLAETISDGTSLVSIMWANNETGVLFDVERIARITHERGVPLHVDAVQAAGKVPIDVGALPVQLLSISAHKFHGPKGAAALYVRRRMRLRPLIIGGRQERDLRGGTENVPAIIGMGIAAAAARNRPADDCARIARMRDRLEEGILQAVDESRVNGAGAPRIGNTTNIGFRALQAEAILILLSENRICASSGSACSSGSLEPSHVLDAMGVDPAYAHGSVRFSLSSFTTETEIDRVIELTPKLVARLSAVARR